MKKILTWTSLVIIGIVIISPFILLSFSLVKEDSEIIDELRHINSDAEIEYFERNGTTIRYIHDKNPGKDILLMLHGAPGSSGDYAGYWDIDMLMENFELLSADRPGYSPIMEPPKDYHIREQADILLSLIESLREQRRIAIISHSYGGPVASLIAGELDSLCLGHIMVAPVIDPYSEKVFWYSSIPLLWPFSITSTQDWKQAAIEKTKHKEYLMDVMPYWTQINSPTIHIHGSKDWLAPPANVDFCRTHFKEHLYEAIMLEGESHFILWNKPTMKMISEYAIQLANE